MPKLSDHFRKLFLKEKDPFTEILGQHNVKQQIKSALMMDRHILIVGSAGVGKTTIAKNISKLLLELEVVKGCAYHCMLEEPVCPQCKAAAKVEKTKISGEKRFVRIQGSPDLTVEDLLGDIDPIKAMRFGPLSLEAFTPGKIFRANNGILFFDELNRCPEKLQNALLQVLEERKATIGSYEIDIESNFTFIGTMNPEDSAAEKLSDVLLDRFDVIYMGYPETLEIEKKIVLMKGKKLIDVSDKILSLMVYFVRTLRENKQIERKPGVRASIGLYERAQSNAMLKGRKEVSIEDVQEVVISVLAHRIKLKPSVKYLMEPAEFIKEEFGKVSEVEFEDIKKKGGGR